MNFPTGLVRRVSSHAVHAVNLISGHRITPHLLATPATLVDRVDGILPLPFLLRAAVDATRGPLIVSQTTFMTGEPSAQTT